jgi:hypothetical protein
VPGCSIKGGIDFHYGAFAVTPRRFLLSLDKTKIVDVPWDVADGGIVTLVADSSGVTVTWNLARANPEWRAR